MAQPLGQKATLGSTLRILRPNSLRLVSLHRHLALFLSLLLLPEIGVQLIAASVAASTTSQQAQQPATTSKETNRANAERLFKEAEQLFQQQTAESRRQAIEKWIAALLIFRAVGDATWEAITLNNIGNVYSDLGENQKALEYYNQALPVRQALDDKAGVAITLAQIGLVYNQLGNNQKALEYYNRALPTLRAVGDVREEADTLHNIGNAYSELGDKPKALEYYNLALPLKQAVGDKAGIATTLTGIGLIYSDLGERQKALNYYNQALPLQQATGDKAGEADTLNNIGLVYFDLGEKQKALEYYNASLPIYEAVGYKAGEARTLSDIGNVYLDLGDKHKALEYYDRALLLQQAIGDRTGVATTLTGIGIVYSDMGEKHKASEYYDRALAILQEVGYKAGIADALRNMGNLYFDLGDKQKAIAYYDRALSLRQSLGDKAGVALVLYNIAYTERSRGNLSGALKKIQASLEIIDFLRTEILSKQLRASFFASVQDYYHFYIDLLMQLHKTNPSKGYDAEALNASERARARSLLDILAEARADIRTGVDPNLLQQERRLQEQLGDKQEQQIQILSGEHTETQATAIQKEIETLLDQYQQVQAQIKVKSPRYAALTQPQPLTLQQIQSSIVDDNTLLLEYSLGEERSYLWAVTKTSIASYELPSRADIEKAVNNFRQQVTNAIASRDKLSLAATNLSQILLKPVAEQLGNKRLLVVGDGALQYIPFSALAIPRKSDATSNAIPLILEHEIVNLPSASTLAFLRNQPSQRAATRKTVAIIADPVFGKEDDRFKNPSSVVANNQQTTTDNIQSLQRSTIELGINLDRLPYTKQEAEAITSLLPKAQSEELLGFQATRASVTNPNLAQYRIIHFATHGILNSLYPELSGIVFSLIDEKGNPQNGFLRLHDIYNLNLPADLVVLSACQTGIGKEIKGEGLVSLTRGFMYAGTSRVVVSLWNVNDFATAELMSRFYKKMLKDNLQPAAALKAAQVEMSQIPQWKNPYYWAAFTIQGDWK
jgi:CHAT domain-containing protein/Tfp pilus assembly protein PilF